MTKPPWAKYAVGEESTRSNWTNSSCSPMGKVMHVCHRRAALHIIEDDRIRAGLVYDKSILRTRRLPVAWLSPNYWALGSRYGNVEFSFPVEHLMRKKSAYWVEEITDYSPTALRILLSDKDHSKTLTPYDPAQRDGPWWYDAKREKHFWHGDYCLEFMIEGDVPLSRCRGVSFVPHHDNYCAENRYSPQDCPDIGMKENKAGSLFLCRLLSGPYSTRRLALTGVQNGERIATSAFRWSFENVFFTMMSWDQDIYVASEVPSGRIAIARAALAAFGAGRVSDAKALAGLFPDDDEFYTAIAEFACEQLGLEGREALGLKNVF